MNTMFKTTLAAVALSVAGASNAAMITSWGYLNEAGFIDPEPAEVNKTGFQSAGSTILSADTWTGLNWGTAIDPIDGNSSLAIDTPISGAITTVAGGAVADTDFEQGTDITHNNFRINGTSLETATILDGLALNALAWDAVDPIGAYLPLGGLAPQLEISFEFLETNNIPAGGICADGDVAGTDINAPDFGCDDYFILHPIPGVTITINDMGDADPTNDYVQFSNTFDLIDLGFPAALAASLDLITKYEVITRLTGLSLNTTLCGTQPVPCVGFRTEEMEVNELFASFAIRAVPAPATLALLGLGLLSLGVSARRKRA